MATGRLLASCRPSISVLALVHAEPKDMPKDVPAGAEWDTGKFQKLNVEEELHARGINVVELLGNHSSELQQLQRNFEELDLQAECAEKALKDSLTDEEVDRRVRAFLRSAGTRTFHRARNKARTRRRDTSAPAQPSAVRRR